MTLDAVVHAELPRPVFGPHHANPARESPFQGMGRAWRVPGPTSPGRGGNPARRGPPLRARGHPSPTGHRRRPFPLLRQAKGLRISRSPGRGLALVLGPLVIQPLLDLSQTIEVSGLAALAFLFGAFVIRSDLTRLANALEPQEASQERAPGAKPPSRLVARSLSPDSPSRAPTEPSRCRWRA